MSARVYFLEIKAIYFIYYLIYASKMAQHQPMARLSRKNIKIDNKSYDYCHLDNLGDMYEI